MGAFIPRSHIHTVPAIIFLFCTGIVLSTTRLYSQDNQIPHGTISSIEILGLKRTRIHAAKYPLEKFIGKEAFSLNLNDVHAAVKDTGILELVLTEFIETEEGLTLRLTVEEKWAIFPIPLIMSGSGGTNLGFFLADRNAFGLRDMAVVGGMHRSGGMLAMAMYNHTPNREGQIGWNSFFMYGQRKREDQDRTENIHRIYNIDQLRISFGLYYPFTDYFTGSATVSFSHKSLQEKILSPPKNGTILTGITPGISLRFSDWDGYLLSQQSFSLSYHYNLAIQGSSYHQAELRAIYEKSLIPGFRLSLRSGAIWMSSSDPLNEESPQKAQVDILPRNFSARHYAGISAGFEKHLLKTRIGTLSVLGSWQFVLSHGPISGSEIDNGPSGGIRFYLSQLALPAMGANFAYNINSGIYQFNFYIGMEF